MPATRPLALLLVNSIKELVLTLVFAKCDLEKWNTLTKTQVCQQLIRKANLELQCQQCPQRLALDKVSPVLKVQCLHKHKQAAMRQLPTNRRSQPLLNLSVLNRPRHNHQHLPRTSRRSKSNTWDSRFNTVACV
jgi:hypothetical protein